MYVGVALVCLVFVNTLSRVIRGSDERTTKENEDATATNRNLVLISTLV